MVTAAPSTTFFSTTTPLTGDLNGRRSIGSPRAPSDSMSSSEIPHRRSLVAAARTSRSLWVASPAPCIAAWFWRAIRYSCSAAYSSGLYSVNSVSPRATDCPVALTRRSLM
jgi:hypothetical protein